MAILPPGPAIATKRIFLSLKNPLRYVGMRVLKSLENFLKIVKKAVKEQARLIVLALFS